MTVRRIAVFITVLSLSSSLALWGIWHLLHGSGSDFNTYEMAAYLAGDWAFLLLVGFIGELASRTFPDRGPDKPLALETLAIALGAIPQLLHHTLTVIFSIVWHVIDPQNGPSLQMSLKEPANLLSAVLMAVFPLQSKPWYAVGLLAILTTAVITSLCVAAKVNFKDHADAPRSSTALLGLAVSLHTLNTLLMNPLTSGAKPIISHDLSFAERFGIGACILGLFLFYYLFVRFSRKLAQKMPAWPRKLSLQSLLYLAGLATLALIWFGIFALAPSLLLQLLEAPTRLEHPFHKLALGEIHLVLILTFVTGASVALFFVYRFKSGLSRTAASALSLARDCFVGFASWIRSLPRIFVACVVLAIVFSLLALGTLGFLLNPASNANLSEKPAQPPIPSLQPRRLTTSPEPILPLIKTASYPSYTFTILPLSCGPVAWRVRSTTEISAAIEACNLSGVVGSDIIAVGSASAEGNVLKENIRAETRARRLAAMLASREERLHILNLGKLEDDQSRSAQRQLTIIFAAPDEAAPSPLRFDEQLSAFLKSEPRFTSGSLCMLYDAPSGRVRGKGRNLHCSRSLSPR